MDLQRGTLVTTAPAGRFSKPRPAVVLQSDLFDPLETTVVALLTSDLERQPGIRVSIAPDEQNGLLAHSEVMVDVLLTIPRNKVGRVIGRLQPDVLRRIDAALRLLLELP